MATQLEPIQSNYTNGELDPQLAAREEADAYYSGAERARNVLLIPHGGFTRRPASRFRDTLVPVLEQIDLTAGGITVTAPEGGTASNATDGDDTTKLTTTTNIGVVDPYVILHIDFGASFTDLIRFVDARNISTDGAFVSIDDEVRIQWSDDNAVWNDLEQAFPFVTDEDGRWNYRRALTTPASRRYWRLVRIGTTDGTTRKFELGEFEMWKDAVPELLSFHRLMQFEATTTNTYLLVATDRNVRIYLNGIRQADVAIPHTAAQLVETSWTQSLDTLLMFHNSVQPHVIRRLGSDSLWRDGVQAFSNIPTFNFQDQGVGAEPVWSNTAFAGGTVIRGWPRCGTFFKGRLYMAGTADLSQTYWAGAAQGDLFDFDDGGVSPGVDSSFSVTMDTDEAADIFHLEPSDFLFIITGSGPFYQGPRDDPPTPDNVTVQRVRGKKRARGPGFRSFQLDTGIVFLDDSGEQLNEIVETVFRGRFEINNLAFLAPHLIRDPQDITLRRSLSSDRGDLLLLVNSDGSMAVLQTLRDRDFTGWTGWHPAKGSADEYQGKYLAVGTQVGGINGRYFATVERTINGLLTRTLEEFLDNALLDGSVRVDAAFDTITATAGQAVYPYTFTSPADLGDNPKAQLRPNQDATLFKQVTFGAVSTATLAGYEIPAGGSDNASLLVAASWEAAADRGVTSVMFGAQSLTLVGEQELTPGASQHVSLWRLDNPTGLEDIDLVISGGSVDDGIMSAMVVENVDLAVTPTIDSDTESAASAIDIAIVPPQADSLVIDVTSFGDSGANTATGTGHTEVADQDQDAMNQSIGQTFLTGAGAATIGWSKDATTWSRATQIGVAFASVPFGDIADIAVRKNLVLLEQGVDYFVDLVAQTITLSAAQAAAVVAGDIIRIAENIRSVSGLDHLEGETCKARINDAIGTSATVTSGVFTLNAADSLADGMVEVGLDFPDVKEVLVNELMTRAIDPLTEEEARFEVFKVSDGSGAGDTILVRDMPMAVQPGAGLPTIRGRKKRVHTATVVISNTQGFAFGANDEPAEPVPLAELGDFLLDRRPPYRSETFRIRNLQGWTLDGQTEITQRDPVPMTILSVARRAAVAL